MLKEIENHLSDIKKISIKSSDELEKFRIKFLSKKGIIQGFFSRLKDIDDDKRKMYGSKINELKIKVNEIIEKSKVKLSSVSDKKSELDYSLPGDFLKLGSRHPISIVKNKIIDIFSGVGYLKVPNTLGKSLQKNKKINPNGQLQLIHGSKQFLSESTIDIVPKVGDFYFFPNYLMHTVYPFKDSDEERRSISFNAMIDLEIFNVIQIYG